jgi:hypothetical protein
MSKTLILSLAIALTAAGCSKDKDKEAGGGGGGGAGGGGGGAAAPAAKLVELDVSSAGEAYQGWKLMAPEGAVAKEDFGALSVSDGKGFQLEVHSGATDMPATKKEVEANDVNKLKKYVTDSPDVIVYVSDPGMGGPQVHFHAAVKIGGEDFYCTNSKGPVYTQAQTDVMVQACKSLKK